MAILLFQLGIIPSIIEIKNNLDLFSSNIQTRFLCSSKSAKPGKSLVSVVYM